MKTGFLLLNHSFNIDDEWMALVQELCELKKLKEVKTHFEQGLTGIVVQSALKGGARKTKRERERERESVCVFLSHYKPCGRTHSFLSHMYFSLSLSLSLTHTHAHTHTHTRFSLLKAYHTGKTSQGKLVYQMTVVRIVLYKHIIP